VVAALGAAEEDSPFVVGSSLGAALGAKSADPGFGDSIVP
jgi:hypothetical protein